VSFEQPTEVIDLHSHITHPDFPPVPTRGTDAELTRRMRADVEWNADFETQVQIMDERGIDIRVLGTSISLFHPVGSPPPDVVRAINDHLAARLTEQPDRFLGFATIDAFDGERAAAEVVRAIRELSLAGIIVDSTDGSRLIGGPETRATLEAAASLGIPVFVHPTSLEESLALEALSRLGVILDRSTTNSAGLLSILEHQIIQKLPQLRVLFTSLTVGALASAAILGIDDQLRGDGDGGIYVETLGLQPKVIRFAVDVLGVDRVVVGTDWPILQIDASRDRLGHVFAEAGLDSDAVTRISAGNARSLLGGAAGQLAASN
jgi:predicted TIM-barrel fold metal-dependent hydrolase